MKTVLCFALTACFSVASAQDTAVLQQSARFEYSRLADKLNAIATAQRITDQGAPAGALAAGLIRDLTDPDSNVRVIAETTLVRMGHDGAAAARKALGSGDPMLRAAAQRVLDRTHSPSPRLLATR